jgi:hypothetical protein
VRTATAHTFVSWAALTVPCVQSDRETFAFTDERRGLQGTNRGGPTPGKCLLPERFPSVYAVDDGRNRQRRDYGCQSGISILAPRRSITESGARFQV